MAPRIRRRALSLNDKMKILKYFDKKSENYKKSQIAEELDIPMSTLSTILKNRKDTEEKCKSLSRRVLRRKKNKMGKFNELENILVDWIYSMNSQNLQTNGPTIQKRALEIAKDLDITDFTASCGWLGRFKNRHQAVFRPAGDSESDKDDGSLSSLDTFQEAIKDFEPADIFNADEFGIFYKLMPNDDFNKVDKKCEEGNSASERLTILACVNSNGTEKLPLLVIGNVSLQTTDLPCQYKVETHSWMTRDIFINWLKVLDDYFEIQGRLIALFVDNSLVHPKEIILNNVTLILLPPDSECDMPMTQGIVKTFKQNYRTKLIEVSNNIHNVSAFKHNFTLANALDFICESWYAIPSGTISSCFHTSGFGDYYDIDDDDDEYRAEIALKYHDYLYVDFDTATCGDANNSAGPDTCLHNIDEVNEDRFKEEEQNDGESTPNQSSANALLLSVATLRQYLTSIDSLDGLNQLAHIENIVLQSIDNSNTCT